MRVTTKGQVTIPRHVRQELGITSDSEVDFLRQEDGSYRLVKKTTPAKHPSRFSRLRGVATVKMSTDEIMALTRDE